MLSASSDPQHAEHLVISVQKRVNILALPPLLCLGLLGYGVCLED